MARAPVAIRSNIALKLIAFVLVAAALYLAHAAFIPVALALLLSLILSGPVERLHRRGVPRGLCAVLILVIALVALIGIGVSLSGPAQQWYTNAPQTIAAIKRKARPIARFMTHVDEVRKNASILEAAPRVSSPPPLSSEIASPSTLLGVTGAATASGLTFVIVTLFLLSGGPPMLARMAVAFADNVNVTHVLGLIDQVRSEVGQFYLITTMINLGLGLLTGFVMWMWNMPTPFLWGAVAGIFNYVPYAGPVGSLLVLIVVATVSFDTLGPVIGVACSFLLLSTLEGQVVQPLLVGRRMEVNPLLIFLALWFGGLFWGVAGVILATPSLVALKVIAEHSKGGRPMLEFLGPGEDASKHPVRFQRLTRRV